MQCAMDGENTPVLWVPAIVSRDGFAEVEGGLARTGVERGKIEGLLRDVGLCTQIRAGLCDDGQTAVITLWWGIITHRCAIIPHQAGINSPFRRS